MKVASALLYSLLASCTLYSAEQGAAAAKAVALPDIVLTTGKVLHNASIKSQQSATVMILCKEGLLSVPKANLPKDLATLYPVDEKAAKAEASRARERSEKLAYAINVAASEKRIADDAKSQSKILEGVEIVSFITRKEFVEITLSNTTPLPATVDISRLILLKNGSTYEGTVQRDFPSDKNLHIPGKARKTFQVRFRDVGDSSAASEVVWKP
ncbi:MAG: hypothetical protein ABIZ04_21695 [Opitutus sp.]